MTTIQNLGSPFSYDHHSAAETTASVANDLEKLSIDGDQKSAVTLGELVEQASRTTYPPEQDDYCQINMRLSLARRIAASQRMSY